MAFGFQILPDTLMVEQELEPESLKFDRNNPELTSMTSRSRANMRLRICGECFFEIMQLVNSYINLYEIFHCHLDKYYLFIFSNLYNFRVF